jgi:hypothetical protein
MPAIEFSRTRSYLPAGDGISLPVFLNSGAERVKLLAYVDTGASHCLFERMQAELLDLNVEAGDPMAFRTAAGHVDFGLFQRVSHVQDARDVGRRDDEREDFAAGAGVGFEDAGVNPPLSPVRVEPLGFIDFLDLHGNFHFSVLAKVRNEPSSGEWGGTRGTNPLCQMFWKDREV